VYDELAKVAKKQTTFVTKMRTATEVALKRCLEEFFRAHPDVEEIGWEQVARDGAIALRQCYIKLFRPESLPEKTACRDCGKELPSKHKFCSFCGTAQLSEAQKLEQLEHKRVLFVDHIQQEAVRLPEQRSPALKRDIVAFVEALPGLSEGLRHLYGRGMVRATRNRINVERGGF
jgi:hypothetical protein